MRIFYILIISMVVFPVYSKSFKCELNGKTIYQESPCSDQSSQKILKNKREIAFERREKILFDLEKKIALSEKQSEKKEKHKYDDIKDAIQLRQEKLGRKTQEKKAWQKVLRIERSLIANNKISYGTLSPYTVETYPKTVKKYAYRLKELNSYLYKAAEMGANSGKCDFIDIIEISDKSALDNLTFWMDCRNGQRIYISEKQIDQGTSINTQAEKSWSKKDALATCQQAIRDNVLNLESLDIHLIIGTSYSKAEITNNVVVKMDFDTDNALGIKTSYNAACYFPSGKDATVEFSMR